MWVATYGRASHVMVSQVVKAKTIHIHDILYIHININIHCIHDIFFSMSLLLMELTLDQHSLVQLGLFHVSTHPCRLTEPVSLTRPVNVTLPGQPCYNPF